MVTYFYWIFVVALAIGVLYLMGWRLQQWIAAIVVSGVILIVCTGFYYFYLEQMLVKRWGGTMTVSIPSGHQHVASTWKGDNLWIENYNPQNNTCIFQEYSRGSVLEGSVVIKNCNPIHLGQGEPASLPVQPGIQQ